MSADIVTFNILINGTAISSSTEIISIEVDQNNTKNIARIEVNADAEASPIPVNSDFKLGVDIEVKLGYGGKNKTAFKGKITDKGVRISQGMGAKNIFICEDNAPSTSTKSLDIDSNSIFNIDLGCNANNTVEGGIEIQGTLDYMAGAKVKLNNIIEGFPKASIYSITQEVSEGNWFTSLHFVEPLADETKIELSTRNGNKIVLDDENNTISIQDANTNSLVFSDSGIAINSPKDISIKASTTATVKGETGAVLQASSGDVQVKGLNAKITADIEANMEGGANAKVKGGAQLTLKGAMVMIN